MTIDDDVLAQISTRIGTPNTLDEKASVPQVPRFPREEQDRIIARLEQDLEAGEYEYVIANAYAVLHAEAHDTLLIRAGMLAAKEHEFLDAYDAYARVEGPHPRRIELHIAVLQAYEHALQDTHTNDEHTYEELLEFPWKQEDALMVQQLKEVAATVHLAHEGTLVNGWQSLSRDAMVRLGTRALFETRSAEVPSRLAAATYHPKLAVAAAENALAHGEPEYALIAAHACGKQRLIEQARKAALANGGRFAYHLGNDTHDRELMRRARNRYAEEHPEEAFWHGDEHDTTLKVFAFRVIVSEHSIDGNDLDTLRARYE